MTYATKISRLTDEPCALRILRCDRRGSFCLFTRPHVYTVAVMAVSLLSSCNWEDEQARALRRSFSPKIEEAKSFKYVERDFPADGGSVVFHFQTESGLSVLIWDKSKNLLREKPKYAEIRISDSWNHDGFELRRGSILEEKVLELLRTSTLGDGTGCKYEDSRPTQEGLSRLVSRIKDRSLK